MYITYRDEAGLVMVEVDDFGIAICDGKAYFSDGDGQEYRIKIETICEIREG